MIDESIKELWQLIYAYCDAYVEWQESEEGAAYPGFKKAKGKLENFLAKKKLEATDD